MKYGFLDPVCENATMLALEHAGLRAERQVAIDVWFRGVKVGSIFADIVVEGCALLELKSAKATDPAHEAQALNYLRANSIEVGLLINFGRKPEFKRFVFDNSRKQINPLF